MIPKIIWLWWEQGWDNSPYICSYTIKSFKKMNPSFKINLVSHKNFNKYIDNKYNWIFKCQGGAFRADLVRLLLLQKYGGVYADAATFCCVNILDFMKEINFNDFWTFDIKNFNKKPDCRTLGSWFYISMPNTYIINTFTDKFLEVAKKNPIRHIYLLHHTTMTKLINTDAKFKLWYDNIKKISAFQNRIDAKLLRCPVEQKINDPDWFHPQNIELMIKNKEFKILKLRHRNSGTPEQLLKDGTIFRLLIDTYLKD